MKALCWMGVDDVRVQQVGDPAILNPRDAIVRVILSSVCGSDLHLLNGYVPTMRRGDIIGHEFMGEVIETGTDVQRLQIGDRVVVVPVIGCSNCHYCRNNEWSLCDNSNPHAWMQEKVYGYATAGIFGYSHMYGGYAGSHAEYIRVPFADHGAFKIPDGIMDEQAVFASDAIPTGFMAADMAQIQPGDIVAVWGCGAVGQMAIQAAYLKGAERVIAIDRFDNRLSLAEKFGKAEVLNYLDANVLETLKEITGGRGPDVCIDAVGMEAHTTGVEQYYDKVKQALRLQTNRSAVLRQAIMACRKGGTVSVVGVYAGVADKFPIGPLMNKGITLRAGQMHGQRYVPQIFELMRTGQLDPSFLLTHKLPLEGGLEGYRMFRDKTDHCLRTVFTPGVPKRATLN